jgi:CRP-like cAMP-binding protein
MAAVVLQTALGVKVGALLATSAVLTVVIGLALQETLGTLLAGLAIAWEKRVQAGVWLEIDHEVGRVEELGWRSLVLRTRLGERVLIPNSQVTRARVRVLGRGQRPVAVPIRLSVAYGVPPDLVKAVLTRVAAGIPNTVPRPAPQILTHEFADSGIVYEVRLWTLKPWFDFDLTDEFLTRVHAALGRAGMEIPFPQRTLHMAPERAPEDSAARCLEALAACPVFSTLPEAALKALAEGSRWLRFAPEEPVVSVGEASRAMYVVATGEAAVEGYGRELGRLGPGEEFGEIAFLTGEERSATVRAVGELEVVEVASGALAGALEAHAEVADELARVMASRQQVLEDMAEVTQELRRPGSLVDLLRDGLKRLVRDV